LTKAVRKLMNESHIRNVIEAALLAAGKSLQPAELVELFDEGARPQLQDVQAALAALTAEYSNRGIEIKETAAGFRIQVRREMANEISRLWPERPARYSRALLETLALIAYRQPITRAEIEAVRGVAVNPNILKTVIERNWVRVVGHRDVPGRPELLGTTREFLDYFGLKNLDDLPPLTDIKSLGEIKVQFDLPDAGPVGLLEGANGAEPAAGEGADPSATVTQATADGPAVAAEGDADGSAIAGEGAADGSAETASGVADGSDPGEGATAVTDASAVTGEVDAVADEAPVADGAAAAVLAAVESDTAAVDGADVGAEAAAAPADAEEDVSADVTAQPDGLSADRVIDQGDSVDSNAAGDADAVAQADGADGAANHEGPERAVASAPDSALHEAEEFAARVEADLAAGDDDGSDDDELSAAGPTSSELVAGPRDLDE
jgi:segregation and condensation protein B